MRELSERAWFQLCLALGWLLRSVRYSDVRIVAQDGARQVRKHRVFYAPLLLWIGGGLLRILDTGVRVLPQREWKERERLLYRSLGRPPIRIDPGGALVLPCLAGKPLSALLKDPELEPPVRTRAMELAVVALVELHDRGFTHGDAMAENVMVDLESGVAHWLDFETVHDPSRAMAWRRADDLRALLASCLLRTGRADLAGTLRLMLDAYGHEEITRLLATSFASPLRRLLAFHLGQARLSWQYFREIDRLLSAHPPLSRS